MKKRDYNKAPILVFLSYFGAHRKLFMIDMVCALAVAAVDVSFPLVSRYMMYELLPDKLYQTVFTVGIIVVCAFLLRSLLNYTITYFGHMFGIRVEADIRQDLYRHFQELDFDYFDKNRTNN